MCNVYSHCRLNIAADASEDGSQGLFRDRKPALLKPVHIIVKADGTERERRGLFDAIEPGNYLLFDIHCWKEEIDDGPLGRRGWVIQERALSSRTVHFAKSQVAWECRQLVCSEVLPSRFLGGTSLRRTKAFIASKNDRNSQLMRVYRRLKNRQLTKDRLDEEFYRLEFGLLRTRVG